MALPAEAAYAVGAGVRNMRRSSSASRGSARTKAAERHARVFRASIALMIMAALFSMGRVALAARAVEASFEATRLREDIRAERRAGDRLEADQSALTTPSRIEEIAGAGMRMVTPTDVRYVSVGVDVAPSEAEEAVASLEPAESAEPARPGSLARAVAAAMYMAAGEAQVLLVGDVGLTSSQ